MEGFVFFLFFWVQQAHKWQGRGWNSSLRINQIQCNNHAILKDTENAQIWSQVFQSKADKEPISQTHLDPTAKQSAIPVHPAPSSLQPPPPSVYRKIFDTQSNMKGWVLARVFLDAAAMWHLWKQLRCQSSKRKRLMSLLDQTSSCLFSILTKYTGFISLLQPCSLITDCIATMLQIF